MKKTRFKLNETLLAGILTLVIFTVLIVWYKPSPDSFRCPNDYSTAEEYIGGMGDWVMEELRKAPSMTQEELENKRAGLFIKYKCEKSRWTKELYG
jgi:hypothetical protein